MMRARRVRLALLACMLLGTALILASCGHDRCANPDPVLPDRQTPQDLLEFFTKSLENRDIAKYEECLDSGYRFRFMPQDWEKAGVGVDRPYWERTEDIARTGVMFLSTQVESIRFELGVAVVNFFVTGDTLLEAVYRPDIRVIVKSEGEEHMTFWVHQSLLTIFVTPDPGDPALWVIRRIEETPTAYAYATGPASSGADTEPDTFGNLKSMFR